MKITPQGISSVFATGVGGPEGLTFGPDGNLYVAGADLAENSVKRFNGQTGQLINTFVTTGSGGLSTPSDVDFGPDGNLYVSSFDTDSVLRYNGTTGAPLGAFVPTGSGGLDEPFGMAFRNDGNLYVASFSNAVNAILRYNGTTGAFIDPFVPPGSGGLDGPLFFTNFPAGELQFQTSNFSVNQNAGNANITILRNNGSSGPVDVQFTTSNGTAVAGIDYTDATQVISFTDGQTSKSVAIPIINNGTNAGKMINLALSDPTDDATLGTLSTALLTILKNGNGGGGCHLGQGETATSSGKFIWLALLVSLMPFCWRKNLKTE